MNWSLCQITILVVLALRFYEQLFKIGLKSLVVVYVSSSLQHCSHIIAYDTYPLLT